MQSISRFFLPALTLGLAASCSQAQSGKPWTATPGLDLEQSAAGLEYRVGSGSWRKATAQGAGARILVDEARTGPSTRLYASLNAGPQPEIGALADDSAATIVEGHLGGAAALGGPARFELEGSVGALGNVSLWFRPTRGARGPLLEFPGHLSLELGSGGRVSGLYPAREGEKTVQRRFKSKVPVRYDEWNFLACSWELQEFKTIRLDLNADPMVAFNFEPAEAAPAAELVLHGSAELAFDDLHVSERHVPSSEWEEMRGSIHGPEPVAVTVRSADGVEQEYEIALDVSASPRLAGDELHGLQRDHLRRVDGGLVWCEAQWTQDHPVEPPFPRTTVPQTYVGDHRIWVYSGEVSDSRGGLMVNTEDVWEYDLSTSEWIPIPTEGPAPMGRCHQGVDYSPEYDMVLLPGGWTNGVRRPNGTHPDFWAFDRKTGAWRELAGASLPGKSSDAPFTYRSTHKDFVLLRHLFGFRFDPATVSWSGRGQFEPVTELPDVQSWFPCGSASIGFDPKRDQLVSFGGELNARDGTQDHTYLNVTRIIDYESGRAEVLQLDPSPSPRARTAFTHHPRRDRFVLFGGTQNHKSEREGDLWTFDLESRTWTEQPQADPPTARGGFYDLSYDPELDVFALVLGRHAKESFLNDVWRLRLDERESGRVAAVFDLEAVGRDFDRVFAETTGDGECAFRCSSSVDNRTWTEPVSAEDFRLTADARYLRVELETPAGGEFSVLALELRNGSAETPGVEALIGA